MIPLEKKKKKKFFCKTIEMKLTPSMFSTLLSIYTPFLSFPNESQDKKMKQLKKTEVSRSDFFNNGRALEESKCGFTS